MLACLPMRRLALIAAAIFLGLGVMSSPVRGQAAMTVGEFLTRAESVSGPLSAFSKERRALMGELGSLARGMRRAQSSPATRDPRLCLPERAELNLERLISDLERIPAAERGMPLREGFRRSLTSRYPCSPR